MKKEIYICDRCGAQGETKDEVEALGLGDITLGFKATYNPYGNTQSIFAPTQTWDRQWCRKCRTDLGVLETEVRKNPETAPSLEDMVREIVRQEIPQSQN